MSVIIAPSILSADPLNLQTELTSVEVSGADWHHIDVMDGHFVPNLTFGLPLVQALKRCTRLPLDVHLMVTNPDDVVPMYTAAGATIVTFHMEAAKHPYRLAQMIRKSGAKAGVALNPGTNPSALDYLLDTIDLILVMSVNPGFSGQAFIPSAIQKVGVLKERMETLGLQQAPIIQVDGGVHPTNIRALSQAGARAFVAGSYIYESSNRAERIQSLRDAV